MRQSKEIVRKVADFIHDHKLCSPSETLLIGVSGGVDSLVLLSLLNRLGFPVKALHCNFQLRGDESVRDENHTRLFCQKNGIPLLVKLFTTEAYARENHLSIEMAARELRYNWFNECIEKGLGDKIAVGHHRDDSIETFFLNLLRGTGYEGLTGIKPVNGKIIRPLLSLSREEIECYASEEGIDYITDSSNLETTFVRNKIRLELIPLLRQINPQAEEHIAASQTILNELASIHRAYLREQTTKLSSLSSDGITSVNLCTLRQQTCRMTHLFTLLAPFGFNPTVIKQVGCQIDNPVTGKMFYSDSHVLLVNRDRFLIQIIASDQQNEFILNAGMETLSEPFRAKVTVTDYKEGDAFRKKADTLVADFDKLRFPLHLRKWKQGDHFQPLGTSYKQLISDYFSDHHFSRFEKEETFLLCDAGGEIIWIVGHRTSDLYKVTKQTTKLYQIQLC